MTQDNSTKIKPAGRESAGCAETEIENNRSQSTTPSSQPEYGIVLRDVIENAALGDELRVLYSVYRLYVWRKTGPKRDQPWVWRPKHLMEACGWSKRKYYRVICKARKLNILPKGKEDYPLVWDWPSDKNVTLTVPDLSLSSDKNGTHRSIDLRDSRKNKTPASSSTLHDDQNRESSREQSEFKLDAKERKHAQREKDGRQERLTKLIAGKVTDLMKIFYAELGLNPADLGPPTAAQRKLANERFRECGRIAWREAKEAHEQISDEEAVERAAEIFEDVIVKFCQNKFIKRKTWLYLCSPDSFRAELIPKSEGGS